MKKFLSLVAVMAVAVMASSTVWADFTPVSKTAVATFGSAPALSVSVNLYSFVADKPYDDYSTTVDQISFNVSNVSFASSTATWASGTTFAKLSGNLIAQPAGTKIYMYTNNTASGDYQAKAARNENGNKYNGLVRKGQTTVLTNGDYAPMKIICKKKSEAPTATYPTDFTISFGSGSRYVLDKSDSNFATQKAANDCHLVVATTGNAGGFWCGCKDDGDWANWWTGSEDLIMFFGAQFSYVSGGSEYGTTTITFSTVTE